MSDDIEDVSLEDVIMAGIDDRMLDVHTALPGKVQSYNKSRQSVDVILQVHRQIPTSDGGYVAQAYAVVPDVPVCFPAAGGMIFTLPVKKDDFCLVVFSEASLAAWRQRGEPGDPGDPARHHLSGAIALMGMRPIAKVIQGLDENNLILGKEGVDNAQLEITSSEIHLGKGASNYLALANKVDQEFNKIVTTLGSLMSPAGPVTASTPYTPSPTASTNAKAK
jgi:Phage protein Gp138 N-terminal domain